MNRIETISEERKFVASVGGSVLFEQKNLRNSVRDLFNQLIGKDVNPVKFDRTLVMGLIGLCNTLLEKDIPTFLVVGGGNIARNRQDDARSYGNPKNDDQIDFVGRSVSEANASELMAIFQRENVNSFWNPRHKWGIENREIGAYIRGGTEPGQTTDMVTMQVAVAERVNIVVNISNTPGVHPIRKNGKLNVESIIEELNYDSYMEMFDPKHSPGVNIPFEWKAAELASQHDITTILVGREMDNLNRLMTGESFKGTVLHP